MVGDSPAMAQVLERVKRAAAQVAPVLLVGEPGTGRRHIARAIHLASRAQPSRFGVLRDGARPPDVEQALAACAGGTLFVGEIAGVGAEAQAALGRSLRAATTRLAVATERELAASVDAGRVRADLAQELGEPITLPPLRARRSDIALLVEHFLGSFCSRRSGCVWGASEPALRALRAYDWPGNIRELRAAVEHAITAGRSGWIRVADLPEAVRGAAPGTYDAGPEPELPTIAETEARLVRLTLLHFRGNKAAAARSLGISRHRLYETLRRLANP